MRQKGLTVITDILPGKTEVLRTLLESIGNNIEDNTSIKFSTLESVHFLRWVIVDETVLNKETLSAKLVLSTNYDGPLDYHLKDLCDHAEKGLLEIYQYCKDAPTTKEGIASYFKKHSKPIAAFYRGTAGRKVSQTKQEQQLWQKIQDYLQTNSFPTEPLPLKQAITDHINQDKAFAWTQKKYKKELTQRFGLHTLVLIVLGIIAGMVTLAIKFTLPTLLALGAIVIFLIIWWSLLRKAEKKDEKAFITSRKDPSQIAILAKKEDYKVQNQLTHLVAVKPGYIRLYTLKFVLWAINLLARMVFNKGNLGGIQSIHFARWVFLDNGKRLLFFSNYDGSWESYLGEFVDRASVGLTGVWSNTVGFPPTKNLIKQGARYSTEFKSWAREKQIPTQVWYSAYPTASIKNINNNTVIRQGLHRKMKLKATKEWLQRL